MHIQVVTILVNRGGAQLDLYVQLCIEVNPQTKYFLSISAIVMITDGGFQANMTLQKDLYFTQTMSKIKQMLTWKTSMLRTRRGKMS